MTTRKPARPAVSALRDSEDRAPYGESTSQKRLLAVFAHPDDESFAVGSTLARYAAEGVDVTLICATRGEAGRIAPGANVRPENLGEVRERELRAALEIIGANPPILLGYRDSGRPGTPENAHPRAFINAPVHEAARRVARAVREVRPHVMLTFDPTGGYGHPDHIRISEVAARAFRTAGDAACELPDGPPPWKPLRLYYYSMSRLALRRWQEYAKAHDPVSTIVGMDVDRLGFSENEITTALDVSRYRDVRARAVAAHRSQASPFDRAPAEFLDRMLSTDYFVRAEPPWTGGARESDLFEGLQPPRETLHASRLR